MPTRRKIVGVMGSGVDEHLDKAQPLGVWIAQSGFHLLTGGGGGVMASVSRAFASVDARRGLSIGVIPGPPGKADPYPNDWIDLPIRTHLPLSGEQGTDVRSRNHINVLSSDVIVALPGGAGTASEVRLAIEYGRPVIAFVDRPEDIPSPEVEALPTTNSILEVQRFILDHSG